jgi:O-antigen/teichoic acid export membrane protein
VNVSDFGLATVATRHLAAGRGDPDRLMGTVVTVRVLMSFGAALLAIGAAFALGYPAEVKAAVAVASLSFFFMVFSGSYYAAFAANLRMEYAVAGNVAQALVTLGGMGLVAYLGGGLIELVIAYNAAILANSLVSLYFARRFVRPRFGWERSYATVLLRESAPIMIAGLVINAYDRVDIIMIKIFMDSADVGHYGFSYRVIDLAAPLSFLFVSSVYPLLSAYHEHLQSIEFRQLFQRSLDFLSSAALCLATVIALFAPHVVRIVGGEAYGPAVRSLQILTIAFALIWVSNLVNYSLISTGRQSVLLWVALFGLSVNVSANLVMIPTLGKEGAAAATGLTEAAIIVPSLFILARYMGGFPSFMPVIRMAPFAAIAAVAVYALPIHWLGEVAVAGTVLATGLLLARVISIDDIRAVARRERPLAGAPATTMEAGTG